MNSAYALPQHETRHFHGFIWVIQRRPGSWNSWKWLRTGSTVNLKRCGRPKKISKRGTGNWNVLLGITGRWPFVDESKEMLVSSKTISRNLHSLGFMARRPCKKPLISKLNKYKRLAFYSTHKTTEHDFRSQKLAPRTMGKNAYRSCESLIRRITTQNESITIVKRKPNKILKLVLKKVGIA